VRRRCRDHAEDFMLSPSGSVIVSAPPSDSRNLQKFIRTGVEVTRRPLLAENPRRSVFESRLARSSDGLGNPNGLDMEKMTQQEMKEMTQGKELCQVIQ